MVPKKAYALSAGPYKERMGVERVLWVSLSVDSHRPAPPSPGRVQSLAGVQELISKPSTTRKHTCVGLLWVDEILPV